MRRVVVYWEKMNHLPVCHQLPTRQNPLELPSAGQLPQGGTANNTIGRVPPLLEVAVAKWTRAAT